MSIDDRLEFDTYRSGQVSQIWTVIIHLMLTMHLRLLKFQGLLELFLIGILYKTFGSTSKKNLGTGQ